MRSVAPRPASTTNQRSPTTIAVDAPAWFASGLGYPVPRRMSRTLSKNFVINDLRPRLHRLARGGEPRARHPFAAHLLGLDHDDVARGAVEDEAGAEVHAADLGRLLVDDADEAQVVVA